MPAGSTTSLVGANTATPTFLADEYGVYEVQLVVSDPWAQSESDTVIVSFENVQPVADAGSSQSVVVGDTVTIDGSGSSDANGDTLTYNWSLNSAPAGSLASIAVPTDSITGFVPDLAGTYVVQLVVNDGYADSDPDTIQVQAVSLPTAAIEAVQCTQDVISSLDPSVFKNRNMKKALLNKLNAVLAKIEAGEYADALGKLEHDILGKTDGCGCEISGAPDKNDWVRDCESQASICPCLFDAIARLEELL